MTQSSVIQLQWRRRVAYTAAPVRDVLPLAIIGIVFAVLAPVIGYPLMSIAFLGISAIPLVNHLHSRVRIEQAADGVSLRQQPPLRNGVVLLPLILALMAAAAAAQVVVGADGLDWRLPLIAVSLCGIAILSAIIAFRRLGPVHVTGTTIAFRNGKRFTIEHDEFVVESMPRGAPAVKFTDAASRSKAAYLTRGQYGTDAETVVAVLELLRVWKSQNRTATAAEISALLSVKSPTGLDVGESVVIEVFVPDQVGISETG